jgi:hypothetical protein
MAKENVASMILILLGKASYEFLIHKSLRQIYEDPGEEDAQPLSN